MTDQSDYSELAAHLKDLKQKSEKWHATVCSSWLNEEEQGEMQKIFAPSPFVVYDGGYPEARKKKVIFRYDEEDDFSDIVCLRSDIDQRFRKIGHRDILGALMHLQIERSSFGDFWIADDHIYLYTSESMAKFLIENLIRINQLTVSFEKIDERPVQVFKKQRLEVVIASERLDAIVAVLAHCSRSKAKEMIRQGLVQINHVTLEEPDELCNNNVTISIRGTGRFTYAGIVRETRNGRIVGEFLQDM
jgi:RNA-binding protein YlmH